MVTIAFWFVLVISHSLGKAFGNQKSLLELLSLYEQQLWEKILVTWMVVPNCLMWCLWRERNNRSFEDTIRTILDLKLFCFRTLLEWLSARSSHSLISVADLIDLCNLCDWLYNPCIVGWPLFGINNTLLLIPKKKKKDIRLNRNFHYIG